MIIPIKHIVDKPIRYIFRKAGAEVVYNKLVKPYFSRLRPQLALSSITALNAGIASGAVYITDLQRDIFNHLADKDMVPFFHDLESFAACSLGIVAMSQGRTYIKKRLKNAWSDWAKEEAIKTWYSPENRKRVVTRSASSQPEQRITGDIDNLVDTSESLTVGLLSSVTNGFAFSYVLFNLSPRLLAGTVALCVGATWLIRWAGKGLVELNHEQVDAQNNLRNGILDASVNELSIAAYGGEKAERAMLDKRQKKMIRIGNKIAGMDIWPDTTKDIIENISFVYPFLFIAKNYFRSGSAATIGDGMQTVSAFNNLRSAGNWYGGSQPQIINFKACAERLTKFLKDCEPDGSFTGKYPAHDFETKLTLSVQNLVLTKPTGEVLCKNVSFDLHAGDRLALIGPSSCGKTTLLYQLAGVLPHQEGDIIYSGVSKKEGEVIFVPQVPYVPDMSLKEVLSFPKIGVVFSDGEMQEALEKVGLNDIVYLLKNDKLTGRGLELLDEQQKRLNFARLILHKPLIVGLDEVTAGLHQQDRTALYKLLLKELPDSIIISSIHHDELLPLHNVEGRFADGEFSLNRRTIQDIPSENAVTITALVKKSKSLGPKSLVQ